jgi:hypothetical protein
MKTASAKGSGSRKPRDRRVDPLLMMSVALVVILACFAALLTA